MKTFQQFLESKERRCKTCGTYTRGWCSNCLEYCCADHRVQFGEFPTNGDNLCLDCAKKAGRGEIDPPIDMRGHDPTAKTPGYKDDQYKKFWRGRAKIIRQARYGD